MQFANVEWRDTRNGIPNPYSLDFNDVYFSSDDGLAETEYVFIERNQLKQRFSTLKNPLFTIAETGFGTGLNFLAVASYWLALSPKNTTLRFISIEKQPLQLADLSKAIQIWPQFSAICNEFVAQYTELQVGLNIIRLSKYRIQLDLYVGDITTVLPIVSIPDHCVDAWLLDGFAPAKNPEMWSQNVISHIARLSNSDATFATFTSAGFVRRNLQAAGFTTNKHPGYGKKREMLSGYFSDHST